MNENTLGKMVGVITDTFKVTNDKGDEVTIRMRYDFSTCSDNDIRSWLAGNRRISAQRPLRGLSVDEIKALDGSTIMANEAGRKVKSREEKIRELVNAGLPENLAKFAVDNPERFEQVVGNISTENQE